MKNSCRLAAFAPIAIVSLLTFSLLGVSDAQAQSYAQGVASVQMKRKCKDDMPRKREDYDAALSSAKVNSIRSWTAQKSTAFAELYQNSEQEIIGQIDTYLLNPVIMSKCDKKTFTISVRSVVNESALGQLMARNKPQNSVRSRMTAVFVARKQMSVKSYDAKVTKISESQEFSEAEQSADVSGSGMAASGYS